MWLKRWRTAATVTNTDRAQKERKKEKADGHTLFWHGLGVLEGVPTVRSFSPSYSPMFQTSLETPPQIYKGNLTVYGISISSQGGNQNKLSHMIYTAQLLRDFHKGSSASPA